MPSRHLLALAALAAGLSAADATSPGVPVAPTPTTCGIGVEWPFSGDDDGDGRVALRYRPAGGAWRTGMPLFRIPAGTAAGRSWSSRHAGSLFDLAPATTYEIELTLADPDGGGALRTLTATTRALPAPAAGAVVRPATPASFAGVLAAARAGDIVELAAGTYPGFTLATDGEPGRPLVVRAAAGAAAVIDGSIELIGRRHVQLGGLTVNGRIRLNASRAVAITCCTVNARADRGAGDGIVSFLSSQDAYIADNTVLGTTMWSEAALGVSGANLGEGICLTGPGHVIRNNHVRGFRDGISLMEYAEAVDQHDIDIVENEVAQCADDGIEADFAAGNVRVLRNRLTDCFMGISSQPGLGGPLYLVRNALYNVVFEAFKLHNGSHGDVLLHNTVVKQGDALSVFAGAPITRLYSRNNLVIGGPGRTWGGYDTGSGRVMWLEDLVAAGADLDYDGFGSTAATFTARFAGVTATSLADLRRRTTEAHAQAVDLGVFAAAVAVPAAPMSVSAAADLRPRPGGAAVDRGVAIPGINDGFGGTAPDLGAYEAGTPLPPYGPRDGGVGDAVPPRIGGLGISAITADSALVSWTTDEPADSQVDYGPDAAYGLSSPLSATLTTTHAVTLGGLAAGTVIHLQVRSCDAAGNAATSADASFRTADLPGVPPAQEVAATPLPWRSAGSLAPGSAAGGGSGGCGTGALGLALAACCLLARRRF